MDIAYSLLFFFEIIAFIFSIYYFKRIKTRESLYFMLFLGFTVFIEMLGFYPRYLDDFAFLAKLKGTVFERNFWLYNIWFLISFLFYTSYFKWNLSTKKTKYYLTITSWLYLVIGVFVLIFYDFFFYKYSPFTLVTGTLMVFSSVSLYYFELLMSDKLLTLKRSLSFYVSIGVLIFYICFTPIFIFSVFLEESNPEFIAIYTILLIVGNYILYSSFIVGFLVCSKKKVKLKLL